MQSFVKYLNRSYLGVAICLALLWGSAACAQEVTAKTLVDRAQIQAPKK
jgi:hypothetical protein